MFLYENCTSILREDNLEILFMSLSEDTITQRQLNFYPDGTFKLRVHCKPYSVDNIVKNVQPVKRLTSQNIGYFVDRMVGVINFVRQFDICVGADEDSDFKDGCVEQM